MSGVALATRPPTDGRRPGARAVLLALVGWLSLLVSVGVYLLVSAGEPHPPFHVGLRGLRFFDLAVYRGAVERVLHGGGLYARPVVGHFGFTYPPFSALVLSPLALGSFPVDKVAVTVVNLGALVGMCLATLRLARVRPPLARRLSLAAGLAAGLLWLEPVTETLGYGQIDLVIVALIVIDLARGPGARGTGVGIGLAAALKLTPLLFIPYLWLSGRRRSAATALATFIASVAVAFLVPAAQATRYWFDGVAFDSARVGLPDDVANQSLRGALARWFSQPRPGLALLVVVAVVGAVGLGIAVNAARRGRPELGFGLCALTTLLVSPISWTHHWVLAVPPLVLLGIEAVRRIRGRRSGPAAARWGLAAATLLALAIGYSYWPDRWFNLPVPQGLHSSWADAYVIAGLLAVAFAAVGVRRSAVPRNRRSSAV